MIASQTRSPSAHKSNGRPRLAWLGGERPASLPVFIRHEFRRHERIARFAGVGVASSILYATAVFSLTSGLRIHPDISAMLGYAVATPFNFLAHRTFTFDSTRRIGEDAARYVAIQCVAILVSSAAMSLCVDSLHLPYVCGVALTIITVPLLTYLLMSRWAFGTKLGGSR